jgi:hypothetical protein
VFHCQGSCINVQEGLTIDEVEEYFPGFRAFIDSSEQDKMADDKETASTVAYAVNQNFGKLSENVRDELLRRAQENS